MSPVISLDTLPAELLLHIAHQLPSKRDIHARDINALAQTNRHLYTLINPHLYEVQIRKHGPESILVWAAKTNRVETAKNILETTNDTTTTDLINRPGGHFKLTPLSWAAAKGQEAIVELLLTYPGINPDPRNPLNRSPLSHAAENGHLGIVKRLLETGGCDVNSKDYRKERTPLMWAIALPKTLTWPVRAGSICAHRKRESELPWSPDRLRYWGVRRYRSGEKRGPLPAHEHCECLATEYGERKGREEVRWAAGSVCEQIVMLLLEHGADVNAGNVRRSALALAVECGSTRLVRLLLDRGADGNGDGSSSYGNAPLARAARNGDVDMVTLLLERGVISALKEPRSPPWEAAGRGYVPVLKVLLNHPLGPLGIDGGLWHDGALTKAAKYGHIEAVRVLLEWHQRIRPDERPDPTSIWWAAYGGWEAIFKLLLDAGTPVQGDLVSALGGISVLSAAVMGRNLSILKLVLAQPDVDVNGVDTWEWTPMRWAATIVNEEAMDLLAEHGALPFPREPSPIDESNSSWRPPHTFFQYPWSECTLGPYSSYPLSFGGAGDEEYIDGPALSEEMKRQFEGWSYNRPVQK